MKTLSNSRRVVPEEFAAEGAEFVVEQLYHMETIKHMNRLGRMFAHRLDVRPSHVGGLPPPGPEQRLPFPEVTLRASDLDT